MAVSGTGPFENDDALDFLNDLDDEPSLETLTDAFDSVLAVGSGEYLDVDLGASAVAAVEVLVAALTGVAAKRPLRVRTLASVKKFLAAQPPARRAWVLDKAQAAVTRALGGLSELADQWDELSKKKGAWRADRERLVARLGREHAALTVGLVKKKPKNAPKEAFFDPEEGQWKVEPRDERGRDHGTAMWFRPDGTLETTSTYVHGVATGPWVRLHESGEVAVRGTNARGVEHGTTVYLRSKKPTSEVAFDEVSDDIVRIECDYAHGSLLTTRWFDAGGRLVTPEGEPWPERPDRVPKEATFNGGEGWVFGGSAGTPLMRHGVWRFWDRDGKLLREVRYDQGRVVEKSKSKPRRR